MKDSKPSSSSNAAAESPAQGALPAGASSSSESSELSEARFRTMFEQSPLSTQVLAPDGRTLRVNRAWEELWGLTLSDVANYNVLEDPQLIESGLMPFIQRGFAGETAEIPAVKYDPWLTVHGGRTRWVRGFIYPVLDKKGAVSEVVLLHQDITEQREAEESRRQSEERYRAFMEQSTEAIWRIEVEHPIPIDLTPDEQIEAFYREGHLAECNDVMARMYGYSHAHEVIGARLGDFLPREDPENIAYLHAFIDSRYRLENAESREVDKDGATKIFSNNLVGIVENGLLVRAWGTQRDITENRRAEEALRESEERFRSMANSAPVLLWVAGPDMRCTWFNKPWLEFTGRTLEEEINNGWCHGLHGDDLERCLATYTASFQARQPFRLEYRTRRHDGEYRWLLDQGLPRYTSEGEFFGFIGSCIDITERKEAEDARARLAAIVESSDDAIIGESLDGTITSWNSGAERIFGYSAAEAVGQPISMLLPKGQGAETGTGDASLPACTAIDGIETLRCRKDGESIQVALTVSPIRDSAGNIAGASTIARDITVQKRIESDLREQTEVVETVNEVGRLLAAELDIRRVVQIVTDAARDLVDAQYCAYFYNLLDENGQLNTFYSLPIPLEEAYPRFPMRRSGEIFGPTFRGEAVIRVDDLMEDPRYLNSEAPPELPSAPLPVRSYLAVPVISRSGEVLGGLFYGHEEVGFFSEREEQIVIGLAAQASVAMDNARLFESLERERTRVAASENRYRTLAEAMPQILWTTLPDGNVDYFNQRWHEFTGLAPTASLGWGWIAALHPDDVAQSESHWRQALEAGENYQTEYRLRREHDGAYRWHLARAAPLRDSDGQIVKWLGTCTDIDDQKRAQETMRFFSQANVMLVSSLEFQETLENAARLAVPDLADWCFVDLVETDGSFDRVAVAHADPSKAQLAQGLKRHYSSIRTVSHSISQVALTGRAELVPEVSDDIVKSVARDVDHLKMLRQVGMRSFMCVPLIALRPEGTTHPLGTITFISSASGRIYDETDMGLAQEIARRAALAVDNARLYQEAQQARDTAEAANRAKDEFLATISHELRTPLTAALGWSYLLRSSKLDKDTAERALDTIERNIKSQAQIVEDLLDVSRIISGKLSLDVRPLDLRAIIDAALDTVRPAAEAKSILLQTDIEPDVGPISGDPNRLQQVIWNLLANAVKFTPKGGAVTVQMRQIDSQMSISVIDTGQGIAAEYLPYVFDRFSQADATSTRRFGGLGLGLSIVRHLVELHGGTVSVESRGEGQGATFTVQLPLLAVQMREAETIIRDVVSSEPEDESTPTTAGNLSGLRVLVVEDEADARELIATVLEQFGAEVRPAATAAEGFSVLQHWRPDVLVSDIGMPNEDGFSLIAKVRALSAEQGGATPAVALTAYARAQDRLRTLSAGYQVHVPKPVEPEELAAAVASLAGRHTQDLPVE